METKYDTIKVPATPEYILAVIQDSYRFSCQNDPEAEPDMDLSFDSTIDEWRTACDLLPWEELGFALNKRFGIVFESSKWHSLLEPATKKTLKELCEEISKYADKEIIKPVNILGKECLKGGVFLTIRSKLAEAGADVSALTPSSLIEDYMCSHWKAFYEMSSKLFPNKLPVMKFHNPLYWFSIYGLVLSFILLLLGWLASVTNTELLSCLLVIVGIASLLFFYLLIGITAKRKPDSVDFGGLKTFRDMVNCIVEGDSQ